MTVYTVEVNSTEVETDKVRVNWVAENGKLATFSARLTDKTQSVSTGDDVDVKRDGTIIFSGILETIEEEISPSGVFRTIGGRHIGVRVWGRWIEKYTEKIGLGGFWMNNYPHKIAEFFLRPTKSDYPVKNIEYDRLKSGWGIAYDGKTATSSGAATDQEAEYVMSRDNHLGWISSSGSQNNTWVEIDLKQNYTTSGIRVDTRNINIGATNPKEAGYPFFPRGYTIQTRSAIGSWVTRATQSFNHAQNIVESWVPSTARYIRVNGTHSTSFPMEISEIYVYESDNTISDITIGSLATHLPWNCSYLTSNAGGGATTVNVQDGHLFTEGDDCLIRANTGTEEWCEVESVNGNTISISTNHSGGGGLTGAYLTSNGAYLMNLTDGPSLDLEYMRISEALTKICALTIDPSTQRPWEWWVNNNGSVDMGTERGSDVSGSVGFEYGVKILQSSNKEDIRQRLDRVLVIGKAPKNADSDYNTSGFVDDGGFVEYEAVISDSTLETPAATRVKAEAMLAESDLDENKVTAAVNDTYATNTWGIADTITLTDANTGLSGTYRVMGLSRVYSAGSGEIVTIQGDSIDPDASDYIADANKRIKAEETRTQYEDQWGHGTQSGYNLIFECEDLTKDNNTTIEINSEASNYQEIKRTSGSGAGRVLGGPGVKLLVGEYRVSYRLKVASNVSTDDFVTIGVYTKEKTGGAGYLAEQTLQPAMFTTDDTYQEMGFSFVVDTDYTDIEFRIDGFVTGVTDLYGDYITLATNYIIDIPGTPTTVTNLIATAAPLAIQLTWDELDELDLNHYMIYRNETGDPVEEFYTKSVANAYVDSAVSVGVTYYYTVKGQDWAGNLSPEFSNIASAQPNYITPSTDIEPGTITGDLLEKGIQPYEADITFNIIEVQAGLSNTFNIDVNNGIGGCDITAASGTWDDFTTGDEVYVANSENNENDTVNWTTQVKTISSKTATKITLNSPISGGVDNANDEFMVVGVHDAIQWTAGSPTITFIDTETHDINSGSVNGLGAGWDYLYFDMALTPPDDEEMQVTGIYDDVIGSERGLLCKIQTSNQQNQSPLIIPFKSRGANINVDAIAAQSIDTRALSATAIIGKKFYTTGRALDTPSVGIEFDDAGIQAYSGETTKTFELETVTGQVRVYGADGAFQIWDSNFTTGPSKLGELRGNAGVLSIQGIAGTSISLNTDSGSTINVFDTDSGNIELTAGAISGEIQIGSHLTPLSPYTPYIGTATAPFLQVHAAHGYFSTGVTLTNTAYPADDDHAATKKYVDDQVSAGITYLDPVKDKYDPTGGLPGSPSTGDRWISEATANGWTENYIYEWQAGWTNPDGAPTLGDTVFATDTGETWNYNGSEWVLIASAVNHNSLANIQGGDSSNRWHLDATAYGWMDTGGPLNTIAGLTPTLDNFIVGTGTTWALKTPAEAADSMGLGEGSSPQFTNLTLTGLVPPIGGVVWAGTSGTLFTSVGFEWELATGTLTTDKIIAGGGSLTNMSTLTFTPIGSTKDVGDVIIRARQFYPDTTGTFVSGLAPFTVISTKKVTNLNVDFFDDLDSDQFLRSDVSDAVTGGSTTSWTGVSSDGQLYNSAGDFWIDSTGYGNAVVLYADDGGVQIESNSIPFLKIWDDISTADTGVDVMDGSLYFHGVEIIEWFASAPLLTDGGLVIDLGADNFYGYLTFDHGGIGDFTDPDEDRVVFWNDGVTGFGTLITGNTMKITSDTLNVDETIVPLLAQANLFTNENTFTGGVVIGDGSTAEGLFFGDDKDVIIYWDNTRDSLIMELEATKEFIIETPGIPDKIAQFDPAVGVTLFDGAGNAVLEASTNVTVSADLIPNGSQNLGLATAEWANLFIGLGRIYLWDDQEESIRSDGSGDIIFEVGGVDTVWMSNSGTLKSMRIGAEDLGTLGGELILSGTATGGGQEGGKISLEMGGTYDTTYNEWEIQVWEDDLIINLTGGEANPFISFDPAGVSVNFGGKHINSTGGSIGALYDKWGSIYLSGNIHAIDGTLTITDIDMTGDISIGIGGTVDGVDIGAHIHNATDGSQKVSHDDLTVASVSEDDHHNRQHSLSDTSDHSGVLPVLLGGTGNAGFAADNRILLTATSNALVEFSASTQGQLLVGVPAGGGLAWGNLIGDTGITVTYDTGDLDISVNASEISHGDLADLGADDHTIYVKKAGDVMAGDLTFAWDASSGTESHSLWFDTGTTDDWEIHANTASLLFIYGSVPVTYLTLNETTSQVHSTNLQVGVLQTGTPVDEIYGGTGTDTYAQGDILYASGTTTLARLPKNATATRYLSNTGGSNNPAWAQVNLANGITGILPLASGGTGSDLSPGPANYDAIMFWDESINGDAGGVAWLFMNPEISGSHITISGTTLDVTSDVMLTDVNQYVASHKTFNDLKELRFGSEDQFGWFYDDVSQLWLVSDPTGIGSGPDALMSFSSSVVTLYYGSTSTTIPQLATSSGGGSLFNAWTMGGTAISVEGHTHTDYVAIIGDTMTGDLIMGWDGGSSTSESIWFWGTPSTGTDWEIYAGSQNLYITDGTQNLINITSAGGALWGVWKVGGYDIITTNTFAHAMDSATHTASGLTTGHVLQATGTTTFAWQQMDHSDLNDDETTQHFLQSEITEVGTIATGTWGSSATTIAIASGGTGATSFIDNRILLGGSTITQTTGSGTTGDVLFGTGGAPAWGDLIGGTAIDFIYFGGDGTLNVVASEITHNDMSLGEDDHHGRQHSLTGAADHTGTLTVAMGGTGAISFNTNRLIIMGASTFTEVGAATNDYILTGSAGAPQWEQLLGGTGINVNNGSPDFTISVDSTVLTTAGGWEMQGDIIMDWDISNSHSIWFDTGTTDDWEIYSNSTNFIFYYHDSVTPKIVWNIGQSAATYYGTLTVDTLQTSNPVGVIYGGTGLDTYVQGDILYASGTTTLAKLAKSTTATRYLSNTGSLNNPAWAQVDLSDGVTGTLALTAGGTGTDLTGGGADAIVVWDTGVGLALFTAGNGITTTSSSVTLGLLTSTWNTGDTYGITMNSNTASPTEWEFLSNMDQNVAVGSDVTHNSLTLTNPLVATEGGTDVDAVAVGSLLWSANSTNSWEVLLPTGAQVNDVLYFSAVTPYTLVWGSVPSHSHGSQYLPITGGLMTGAITMGWNSGDTPAQTHQIRFNDSDSNTEFILSSTNSVLLVKDQSDFSRLAVTDTGGTLYGAWTIGSIASLGAALDETDGGTGETTYTAGQLLIGQTGGGLTKATLTEVVNGGLQIISATGSISLELDGLNMTDAAPVNSDFLLYHDATDTGVVKKEAISSIDLELFANAGTYPYLTAQTTFAGLKDQVGTDITWQAGNNRTTIKGAGAIDVLQDDTNTWELEITFDEGSLTNVSLLDSNNTHSSGYQQFLNTYISDTNHLYFGLATGTVNASWNWSGSTLRLEFENAPHAGEFGFTATAGGASTMYHDNTQMVITETTSSGTLTGTWNATAGLTVNTTAVSVVGHTHTDYVAIIGDTMTGTLDLADDADITITDSVDGIAFNIMYDYGVTESTFIDVYDQKSMYLRAGSVSPKNLIGMLTPTGNESVLLYYNGLSRLQTTSGGITVAGNIALTGTGLVDGLTISTHDHDGITGGVKVDYTDLDSIPSSFVPAAHVLATTGPHSGELPLADLASGSQGSLIYRNATDWAELSKGTNTYVLKSGATTISWSTIDWSELTGTQPAPPDHAVEHESGGGDEIDSALNPLALALTTNGDMVWRNFVGNLQRIIPGTTDEILYYDEATGPFWDVAPAGSATFEELTDTPNGSFTTTKLLYASGATQLSWTAYDHDDVLLATGDDVTGTLDFIGAADWRFQTTATNYFHSWNDTGVTFNTYMDIYEGKNFYIRNGAATNNMIGAFTTVGGTNDYVILYYNGNAKLQTSTSGGTLTGTWNATTNLTVGGSALVTEAIYGVHDHGVGDPTQVTYSTLLSIPNTFIPIQHALNSATYHSGDLAYSQLDANINIIGTGQADKISRGDHGHTGSDGSDQVSWANSISGKPTTFAPTDHATEHHVGGGDLVNHDSLTGFSSTVHFTQGSITTVGTITTGIWDATAILADKGGTGLTGLGSGVMLVGNATTTMGTVAAPGATNKVLVSTGPAAFGWTTSVPTHAHTEFLEVDGGNSMVGNLGMSDAGTSSYHIIFTEGITYTWDLYSVASNFYITSDTTDGIFISTTGGTLRGEWTAGGTGVDFNVGGDIVMQDTYTVDGVDVSAHAGDGTIHFTVGSISHDSIADVSIDDHHARDHASEHHVGGGDLVNHDSLTGFSASEHFAKTDIDAIDPAVGSGLVKSTSGVLSTVTDSSTNWNAAYSHVSNDGSDHSYINQAVATTSSPSFQALTLTTDLAVLHGGTGFSTIGVGKIVYASSANTLDGLTAPTITGQMIVSTGAAAFGWTSTIPTHSHDSSYLAVSGGTMVGNILMSDSGTQSYNIRFNEGATTWYMWTSSGTMYITTDATTPVGDGIQLATAGAQVNGSLTVTGVLTSQSYAVLTTNDEGSGNNLDADTVDTYHASSFFNMDNANAGVLSATYGGTGANLSGSTTGAIFRWDGSKFAILGSAGTGSIIYSSSSNVWDALTTIGADPGDVLTLSLGVPTWQPAAAGGVTSVGAGLGMDFLDITTTGDVTMGLPSVVTQGTVNGRTATSHTHQWTHTSEANWEAAASASHTESHTLNDIGIHGGDLAYSQIDYLVDIVGGGSVEKINKAAHVHTGADGSSTLTTLGTVTTGNIDAIANYYTNADVDSRLSSPGLGLDYVSGVISLDLSELTDMTAAVVGTVDELILLDNSAERRKLIAEIALGAFYNDQGWTSSSGTVTSVYDGNGMADFNITGSGAIVLGTPSSITGTSGNSVTTLSHSHSFAHANENNWDLAYAHLGTSGVNHTYINQSVTTSASPTFSYVNVSNQIRHNGDLDTLIAFTTDNINMVAGNVTLVQVHEAGTDSYVRLNDDLGEAVRTRQDGLIFGGIGTNNIIYGNTSGLHLNASTAGDVITMHRVVHASSLAIDLGTSTTGKWGDIHSVRMYGDTIYGDDIEASDRLKIPVGANMYT